MTTQEMPTLTHTAESFLHFVHQPENADKLYEFIAGEVVEMPSNPFSSFISAIILSKIMVFVLENKLGYVTGEAGGYQIAGEYYAPDVAFISKARQPQLAKEGYNPNPPDLAVEVISSSRASEHKHLRVKITNYLSVGTVVWVVIPEEQTIEVHSPGQAVRVYRKKGEISASDALPGFTLKLEEVFTSASDAAPDAAPNAAPDAPKTEQTDQTDKEG